MSENAVGPPRPSSLLITHKRRSPIRRPIPLQVEPLEERNLLSVSANAVFVSSLYQGLLGRPPDAAGLADWEHQLQVGVSRAQVALEIERSDEALGRAIQIYYQDFLGRTADIGGLNLWVNLVRRGGTLEEVKANIFGSDEFIADHGGSMSGYLNGVYQFELGRGIDSAGLAYWTSVTPNDPNGRTLTASNIMRSLEGMQVEIASIYQATLGRAPDAAGASSWVAALEHGESDLRIIAKIIGSDEYFSGIQQVAAASSNVDAAAHEFIVSGNRFNGKLPGAEQLNSTIVTNAALVLPPPARLLPCPFFPGAGTTGPYCTFGPVVTVGPGPTVTAGPTGGGFTGGTGGCCFSGGGFTGGFTGGGFSGGGFSGGGGSGGASVAFNHGAHRTPQGGLRGVGGRGQGSGLYAVNGLLSISKEANHAAHR